ncbi:hypothetical protein ACH5RR_030746 [Cinchona calisaya]|uniref:Uncharacterized protein n=1 Tax=Cinchona calisaya TaxID=153742 RepID=A0ABD2YZ55_9GENT
MEEEMIVHNKDNLKVEIPGDQGEAHDNQMAFPVAESSGVGGLGGGGGGGGGSGGLARQGSITKNNCLCSPTTHAGSFRCRLHRVPPSLQRTKSIDSTTALQDSQSKPN